MSDPRERPNPFEGRTYGQAVAFLAEQYGDRDALVFGGRRWTFAEARLEIDRAAQRLSGLGLQRGDTVALWMPNRPEFLWYWMGAAQSGLIAVFLNTRLKRDEFMYQIAQSRSRVLLTAGGGAFRDFIGELADACPQLTEQPAGSLQLKALPDLRHLISLDPPSQPFSGVTDWSIAPPPGGAVRALEQDPDRPALIVYSSGTTALPKGAMLTHCIWRKAFDGGMRFELTPQDRLYLCVPLFGVMGCLSGVLMFWTHGAGVVLEPRFEPGHCLALVQGEGCTCLHLLPAMIEDLLAHPDFPATDLSRVRAGIVLSNDPVVMRKAADKLGIRGASSGYGMTETTGLVTRSWLDEPIEQRLKSNGKPLPGCLIRIVDPETGKDAATGETGEIWVGGYSVMAGYFDKPRETADTITSDGWLRTGDAGFLNEDGSLVFLRRLKDGYKHNGFNVATPEVEAAMLQHPGVAAAAVVGIPHDRFGEIGIAFAVARKALDSGELMSFLGARLAKFKVPAQIVLVDEFPRTAGTDKIQKFKLKEIALERFGRAAVPARQALKT
ncbi:MAG: AMP-binding protein [Rhodospirillales bacterium]